MPDVYESSRKLDASADDVFAFLSDPAHLPDYLPPVEHAEVHGDRIETEVEIPDKGHFSSDGPFSCDADQRRMEWGSDGRQRYRGWLEVADDATVTVHLEFEGSEAQDEAQERSSEGRDPMAESLERTLDSIVSQVEGGGGKAPQPRLDA